MILYSPILIPADMPEGGYLSERARLYVPFFLGVMLISAVILLLPYDTVYVRDRAYLHAFLVTVVVCTAVFLLGTLYNVLFWMRGKGLVRHDGAWLLPEEVAILKLPKTEKEKRLSEQARVRERRHPARAWWRAPVAATAVVAATAMIFLGGFWFGQQRGGVSPAFVRGGAMRADGSLPAAPRIAFRATPPMDAWLSSSGDSAAGWLAPAVDVGDSL